MVGHKTMRSLFERLSDIKYYKNWKRYKRISFALRTGLTAMPTHPYDAIKYDVKYYWNRGLERDWHREMQRDWHRDWHREMHWKSEESRAMAIRPRKPWTGYVPIKVDFGIWRDVHQIARHWSCLLMHAFYCLLFERMIWKKNSLFTYNKE